MHKEGLLGKSKLIGLVKEIAPCATAKDDSELGVGEFQTKYFNNYPVYLDQEKTFYAGDLLISSHFIFETLATIICS